jgi:hypothetical protein
MKRAQHWLVRPQSIKILWFLFAGVLLLTLLPDFWIAKHAYFELDDGFGFFAWFGFGTCLGLIVLAKLLGLILKRKDTYYGD